MATSHMKMQPEQDQGDSRFWRNMTIVLLVIALVGGGWYAWQAGLLDSLLGESSAQATASGMPAIPEGATAPVQDAWADAAGAANESGAAQPANAEAAASSQATGSGAAVPAPEDAASSDSGLLPLDAGAGASALATAAQAAPARKSAEMAEPVQATALTSVPAITRSDGVTQVAGDGAVQAVLASGIALRATGRSADGVWLAVTGEQGSGWVRAGSVVAYGLSNLAEVAPPEAVITGAGNDAAASTSAAAGTLALPVTAREATADAGTPAASAATTVRATVATSSARLNLRAGPGTESPVIAKAEPGANYVAVGRNEERDWLLLAQDGEPVGWASAAYLALEGDASALPVSAAAIDAPALEPGGTVLSSATSAAGTETPATEAGVSAGAAAAGLSGTGLSGTLVFQDSPGGTIYAYDLESGALAPLTHGFDPAISPDGTQVAFVRDGGQAGLYLINIDGSNERVLFDQRGSLSAPKWSLDGQSILFARNDEGIECYQMGQECLIPSVAEQRVPPEMFEGMPIVKEYQYRLSVVDVNGNNFHDVAALTSAKAPDWGSAGIVYQSGAGIQRTDDAEGTRSEEVAYKQLGPLYFDPDIQPNGGRVVYQVRGAAQWDLWAVNLDGSGTAALTSPATTLVDSLPSNVAAAWSPDGSHIVFLSNRTDENTAGAWRLWMMDADGGNQRALPIDVPIEYTFGAEQVVSWGA